MVSKLSRLDEDSLERRETSAVDARVSPHDGDGEDRAPSVVDPAMSGEVSRKTIGGRAELRQRADDLEALFVVPPFALGAVVDSVTIQVHAPLVMTFDVSVVVVANRRLALCAFQCACQCGKTSYVPS